MLHSYKRLTTSYFLFNQFSHLEQNDVAMSVMQAHRLMFTVAYSLGTWCTYVMVNHFVLPKGSHSPRPGLKHPASRLQILRGSQRPNSTLCCSSSSPSSRA